MRTLGSRIPLFPEGYSFVSSVDLYTDADIVVWKPPVAGAGQGGRSPPWNMCTRTGVERRDYDLLDRSNHIVSVFGIGLEDGNASTLTGKDLAVTSITNTKR